MLNVVIQSFWLPRSSSNRCGFSNDFIGILAPKSPTSVRLYSPNYGTSSTHTIYLTERPSAVRTFGYHFPIHFNAINDKACARAPRAFLSVCVCVNVVRMYAYRSFCFVVYYILHFYQLAAAVTQPVRSVCVVVCACVCVRYSLRAQMRGARVRLRRNEIREARDRTISSWQLAQAHHIFGRTSYFCGSVCVRVCVFVVECVVDIMPVHDERQLVCM